MAVLALALGLAVFEPALATRAAAACPSVELIGARGSGEPAGFGVPVGAVVQTVLNDYRGAKAYDLDYPAIAVDITDPSYPSNYKQSVNQGIANLTGFLTNFHAACSTTPLVLIGFSQGSQVVGNTFQSIGSAIRSQVKALVMFGDPRFNPDESAVDFGSFDPGLNGVWAAPPPGPNSTVRSFTPTQEAIVHSYCLLYDPVCNWSLTNGVNCAPGLYCTHLHYVDFGYTSDAAKWILSRLPTRPAPLHIIDGSLPGAAVGTLYSDKLAAAGGKPPYTWSATGSALSDGLKFNASTHTLTGTPKQAGSFALSVTLKDTTGASATTAYQLTIAPQPPSGADSWEMSGHDAAQTFANSDESLLSASNVGSLSKQWTDANNYAEPPPVVYNGVLYRTDVLSGQETILARSLTSGKVLWKHAGQVWAAGDGEVIDLQYAAPNPAGTLSALNLDGTVKWSHTTSVDRSGRVPTVLIDGHTLLDTITGSLRVSDDSSGQVSWTNQWGYNGVMVDNGTVIVPMRVQGSAGQIQPGLLGLSESGGSQLWSQLSDCSTGGDYQHLTGLGSDFAVVNGCNGNIEIRDVATGNLQSTVTGFTPDDSGDNVVGLAAAGGTLYAATLHYGGTGPDGYALDVAKVTAISGGQITWSQTLPGNIFPWGPAVANGVVYVRGSIDPTSSEMTFALNATSGQILWASPVRADQWIYTPIVAGGRLVVGGDVYGAG